MTAKAVFFVSKQNLVELIVLFAGEKLRHVELYWVRKKVMDIAYKALYRQWRPKDFAALIGQEHVSITLQNAIVSGRISHAYLFTGPRGTGKTSTAKVLAKALNCEAGPTATPCNRCASCELVNEGSSMDVYEIDAASNRGIDEIRELRENVKFSPAQSRYKIYIIDEVHMLTNEAFNALLKTLEEPPAHAVFVLATTEPHRIPATILSRCQRYDFRRVGAQELTEHLAHVARESGIKATHEALRLIALQSDGGVRDAVSILDQCSVMGEANITENEVRDLLGLVGQEAVYALFDAVVRRDGVAGLTVLEQQLGKGKDARQLLIELAGYCRSLMLFRAAPDLDSPVLASFSRERLTSDSKSLSHQRLVQLVELFYQGANDSRWSIDPRITAEMALLTACSALESPAAIMAPQAAQSTVKQPTAKRAEAAPANVSTDKSLIDPAVPLHPTRPAENKSSESQPQQKESASGGSMNEQDRVKLMADLLKRVEQGGKRAIKALLEDARLLSYENGCVTLLFQRDMIRERMEREDVRKWLEELLSQLLSSPVRMRCIVDKPGEKPNQAEKKAPKEAAIPPEVLKLQQIFGGQITKMDKNEGGS